MSRDRSAEKPPQPSDEKGLRRLAAFCVDHRKVVLFAWLGVLVVVLGVAMSAGSVFSDDFRLPDSDSQEAIELLEDHFPAQSGDSAQIVYAVDSGSVADQSDSIDASLGEIEGLDHVTAVASPFAEDAGTVSADGTIAFTTVQFDQFSDELPLESIKDVITTAQAAGSDELQVELGGQPVELVRSTEQEGGGEMIGLLAAMIVLLITFGSVVAAGMPLITALVALGTAFGLITLATHIFNVSDFAPTLAMMIGLGVGIDYALFIVTRFRSGLAEGLEPRDAVILAMDTAGRAVLFAGITVVIALLGMFFLGIQFLHGPAVASSLAVLMTMFSALTLLPAMLSKIGYRIDRLRIPGMKPPDGTHARSRWMSWARLIERRPWPAALISGGLLVALTIPVFSLDLGIMDAGTDPEGSTTRNAYDLLAEGFGSGSNGPLQIVAVVPVEGGQEAADQIASGLDGVPGIESVSPAFLNPAGDTAVINVTPTTSPQDSATSELVTELRSDVLPPIAAETGTEVHVGGITAIFDDFSTLIADKLPLFIGVVVLLSALLLMAVFRSVAVPIKAVIMNLLSIGASMGIVVAIFQWGWLGGLFGVHDTGPILAFLPVMVFAIVFGLSMDYEVFLMSRIHEEWEKRGDAKEAVAQGLGATGRVITAAAAIMVVVFASFALGDDITIKLFGIGLASAVLLDALVIRSVLVPAVMVILGRRAWWLPSWLDRILPRLNVDPAGPAPSEPQSASE